MLTNERVAPTVRSHDAARHTMQGVRSCPRCGKVKELFHFQTSHSSKDGILHICNTYAGKHVPELPIPEDLTSGLLQLVSAMYAHLCITEKLLATADTTLWRTQQDGSWGNFIESKFQIDLAFAALKKRMEESK